MKEQLQKLNTDVEKVRESTSVYGLHTKEYRECLEREIDLLQEQKELVDNMIENMQ